MRVGASTIGRATNLVETQYKKYRGILDRCQVQMNFFWQSNALIWLPSCRISHQILIDGHGLLCRTVPFVDGIHMLLSICSKATAAVHIPSATQRSASGHPVSDTKRPQSGSDGNLPMRWNITQHAQAADRHRLQCRNRKALDAAGQNKARAWCKKTAFATPVPRPNKRTPRRNILRCVTYSGILALSPTTIRGIWTPDSA